MQAADRLRGEICIPKDLTGNDAKSIFVETLAYVELAAALDRGTGSDPNKFFTDPQNAALAAALGMKFKCQQREQLKIRLKK